MCALKKKQVYLLYSKSIFIYLGIFLLIILLVINSKASISAVKQALLLCGQTVIPSLFPFFVLSGLLIQTGFIRTAGKVISPVIQPLFRVSGSGALAFVIGVVSGYPMGAKMVSELYLKGVIEKKEAQMLLPYCNNSGPLFIIGAVGAGMLGNVKAGLFLYAVHITAALCVGFCFRFYGEKGKREPKEPIRSAVGRELRGYYRDEKRSMGEIFSSCVSGAVNTTLLICGFIALFSSFVECLKPIIDSLVSDPSANLIIKGMFEVTAGVNGITAQRAAMPMEQILVLTSLLIGFGGICVHLQVLGMLSGTRIGMKTYLIGKLLHALFAAATAFVAISCLPAGEIFAFHQIHRQWGAAGGLSWQILFSCLVVGGFVAVQLRRYSKCFLSHKRGN